MADENGRSPERFELLLGTSPAGSHRELVLLNQNFRFKTSKRENRFLNINLLLINLFKVSVLGMALAQKPHRWPERL